MDNFIDQLDSDSALEIFTDGACSGNPGVGGWGVVFKQNDKKAEYYGSKEYTTNNQMEMMAAISALERVKKQQKILLSTDSMYLKDGITLWLLNWKKNGWKTANKKSVKNKDLWLQLDELTKKHNVQWKWIKAHDGHVENERADELARQAILAYKMQNL
ncbi:MAG: ribonuclease HI [Alphaproteobacteria bacterium]